MSAIVDLIKRHALLAGLAALVAGGGAVYVVTGELSGGTVPSHFAYTIGTQHGICNMNNTLGAVPQCHISVREKNEYGYETLIILARDPHDSSKLVISIPLAPEVRPQFIEWRALVKNGTWVDGRPLKVAS